MAAAAERLREARGRLRGDHLARNSVLIILNTLCTGLLGIAFWATAARLFPPSGVGLASALISAMTLGSGLGMLGLGTTTLQHLPAARDNARWSLIVNSAVVGGATIGLAAGLGVACVMHEASSRLAGVESAPVVACLVVGTSVLTVATLLDYVFQAERAAHVILARGIAFSLLKLLALLVLPLARPSAGVFALLLTWAGAAAIVSAFSVHQGLRRRRAGHRLMLRGVGRYIRSNLRLLVLHHVTTLGSLLIPTIMPVVVVARVSASANAFFYTAYLLSSPLITVSGAVSGSLLAELSRRETEPRVEVARASRLTLKLLVPATIGVLVVGRFVLAVFGAAYARHGYGVLALFAVVAVPDAATNMYVAVLRALDRSGRAAVLNIGMAIVALGGAWILLPALGIDGAGWAWAGAQAGGTVVACMHALRALRSHGKTGITVRSRRAVVVRLTMRVTATLPVSARRRVLYLMFTRRVLRLNRPTGFSEKINWRIVFDRRPELVPLCDKLASKRKASEAGIRVPHTYWEGEHVDELRGIPLPSHWVLKSSNSTGQVYLGAGEPKIGELHRVVAEWRNDRRLQWKGEWAYSGVTPKLYVEERVTSTNGRSADDYKVIVMSGRARLIQVDSGRGEDHRRALLSPTGEMLPMNERGVRPLCALPNGVPLTELVGAAEELAGDLDMLRVDFYVVEGALVFGEFAVYPGGGLDLHGGYGADLALGREWRLPSGRDGPGGAKGGGDGQREFSPQSS